MTPVRILRDFRISLDGIRVETWRAGSERAVSDRALAILIAEGACEIMAHNAAPEVQAQTVAPENKARRGRPRKVRG